MKKILVIGNCGAGKSTFAERLGHMLSIPVVSLDSIFWLPNWVEKEEKDFDKDLLKELQKDTWIMDGNYNRTLPLRLEFADTVIHLDYSRWICTFRILKRWLNPQCHAEGCVSKMDWPFLWYVFYKYPHHQKRRTEKLKGAAPQVTWVDIKTPKEAQIFLSRVTEQS